MGKEFTGLLDKNGDRIYIGDLISVGMRRGDTSGWTIEKVVRRYSKFKYLFKDERWSQYCLVNDSGERMDMQLDQELRIKHD